MLLKFIVLAVVCLLSSVLGIFVFIKNPKDKTFRAFGGFVLATNLWLLSDFLSNSLSLPKSTVLLMNYLTLAFPVLALYVLILFCLYLTKRLAGIPHLGLQVIALAAAVVTALCFTPYFVQDVVASQGIYKITFGPLINIYFGYIVVGIIIVGIVLGRSYFLARAAERTRLGYVIASIILALGSAFITNLAVPLIAHNFSLVIYAPISALILTIGFSYAIVNQRLFDIRAIIARSVTYLFLLATLATIYGFTLFGISQLFFTDRSSSPVEIATYIVLALILSFTFPTLRQFFERTTDRIFFKNRYDTQDVLDNVGKVLVQEMDIDAMLRDVLEVICKQVHISHGQFFIFNSDRIYKVAHFGPLPQRLIVVPELEHLHKQLILADEVAPGKLKDIMSSHSIRLSKRLHTKDDFVGFLLLGDKLSGDIYSDQDVKLIEIMSSSLAIAIQNAKSYEQIRQFNITLQEKIEQATKRLRVANANLKSLDKAKDEFISMASHQLRTPLTTIKGYVSMILEGDTGPITDEQKEFLNYAFAGSERMVSLISDLLNVSRLAAGRFIIERTPTDIVAVVADEVRQLQSHAAAKNLQLVFTPPATPLATISIDENKTRQVMMNFIDNAIYYTKEGKVSVAVGESKDMVRFTVTDTGIGVPKDSQNKLFTKFYRAGNAQTVRPDGTGLGLYLAKRVIEDQGGTIVFESHEGKGSTFGFEIPLHVPASTAPKATVIISKKHSQPVALKTEKKE